MLELRGHLVESFLVRPSTEADLSAIASIYGHYVLHSLATFELIPPSETEMIQRWEKIVALGLAHVVCENEGEVVGYAYASQHRPREAYRFTVEDSLYIHPAHLRRGIGRRLLSELIKQCEAAGYRQMIAVIGDSPNAASIGLHSSFGFTEAGILRSVGWKFERWVDTVLMQRSLGEGDSTFP